MHSLRCEHCMALTWGSKQWGDHINDLINSLINKAILLLLPIAYLNLLQILLSCIQ